ncbi:MAG: diguanylate cyclase [Candidatus Fimivivens sp.]|nr:diguanylate cyclase [Candidatus Fimivivens sp.]
MNNNHLPIKEVFKVAQKETANQHISQIRQEYKKIDNSWLHVHYWVSVCLVLLAITVEIGISIFLISSNLITITVGKYILKYMAAPACVNCVLLFISTMIMRTNRLPQLVKIYSVSLIFVGICFMLITIHSIFSATYYLFAIAVVLTTIYANYYITCVTALVGLISTVAAQLFIRWDPDRISINNPNQFINFLISLFILTATSFVCIIQIRYEINKNNASIQKELERQLLHERLRTDELTGVFSRKALHDAFQEIDANPTRNTILAIVDLDKFKGINDCLGHHTGDSYLVAFAKILKENNAEADVYRYGGDEFCLLFNDLNMDAAIETCKQLQQKLNTLTFDKYPDQKLTASFGLASCCDSLTAALLFINADQAMYQAKKTAEGICVFDCQKGYEIQDSQSKAVERSQAEFNL